MAAYERLVVNVTPEEMQRIETFQFRERFTNRALAVRALITDRLNDIEGKPQAEPEPVQEAEPEAAPAPVRTGMLPGEELPTLRMPAKATDPLTKLAQYRIQKAIDDTGQLIFDQDEAAAIVLRDLDHPIEPDLVPGIIRRCMSDLGFTDALIREGRPRGQPVRVYTAPPAG